MLQFPDIPEPALSTGETSQIADGVFWLRMPVPGSLKAINVWALAGERGWTLVDCGLRSQETAEAWKAAFSGDLSSKPVERVCVTHMHPDHSGMCGWLTKKHGVDLWMSRLEYYTLRSLISDTGREAPPSAIDFYRAAGWDEDAIELYRTRFGEFGKMVYPLPASFVAMKAGGRIETGAGDWNVITGRGHSPEQSLLYSEGQGLLIAGDQVLPGISSNVSVHPQEPKADPLSDWLESLAEIRQVVPDDVLVLPSHGRPFRGLHERIGKLIEGHEKGLDRLLELLAEPKRAVDVFPALFKRKIESSVLGLATGESLAHLACLKTRGLARSEAGPGGQNWWFRV
jgi:glyoxylase-like metal-dependent hydrolase (beta-lactamase superfamily II)